MVHMLGIVHMNCPNTGSWCQAGSIWSKYSILCPYWSVELPSVINCLPANGRVVSQSHWHPVGTQRHVLCLFIGGDLYLFDMSDADKHQ